MLSWGIPGAACDATTYNLGNAQSQGLYQQVSSQLTSTGHTTTKTGSKSASTHLTKRFYSFFIGGAAQSTENGQNFVCNPRGCADEQIICAEWSEGHEKCRQDHGHIIGVIGRNSCCEKRQARGSHLKSGYRRSIQHTYCIYLEKERERERDSPIWYGHWMAILWPYYGGTLLFLAPGDHSPPAPTKVFWCSWLWGSTSKSFLERVHSPWRNSSTDRSSMARNSSVPFGRTTHLWFFCRGDIWETDRNCFKRLSHPSNCG